MQQRLWIGVGAVAVALIAATVWWRYRSPPAEPVPAPPVVQAPAPKPADVPLPKPAESDARIRSLLAAASPQLREWLSQPELLDRWVVVADNLALDTSPRKQLLFLAPKAPFKALEKGGRATIDPRSYQRYDSVAGAIASVDAKALASAVRELHPWLESAYHKLGYPDRSFDAAAQAALQRLVDAPVVETPPALKSKGAIWLFADEKLESLGPVEKQMLRMGPRNTRVIQAKAREIAAALDLRVAAH
jgi:hypothetical protein